MKISWLTAAALLLGTALIVLAWVLAEAASFPAADPVKINEIVQEVRNSGGSLRESPNDLPFVVIDGNGAVLYRSAFGLSETIPDAVRHRDTILDLELPDSGDQKIILYNEAEDLIPIWQSYLIWIVAVVAAMQTALVLIYHGWINRRILRPLRGMRDTAAEVARGNFEVPLRLERNDLTGPLNEAFDLMRAELDKARSAEAAANASRKELISKLAHDLRTPVASIRAIAELGALKSVDPDPFDQIITKTDQITLLLSNLLNASLDEERLLTAAPIEMNSAQAEELLRASDPAGILQTETFSAVCLQADPLRLAQVFDNILTNAGKYGTAPVHATAHTTDGSFLIEIEDSGCGVDEDDLVKLQRKGWRGQNAAGQEGAGLGLYICSQLLHAMDGDLLISNGSKGLKVTVVLPLSQSGVNL